MSDKNDDRSHRRLSADELEAALADLAATHGELRSRIPFEHLWRRASAPAPRRRRVRALRLAAAALAVVALPLLGLLFFRQPVEVTPTAAAEASTDKLGDLWRLARTGAIGRPSPPRGAWRPVLPPPPPGSPERPERAIGSAP